MRIVLASASPRRHELLKQVVPEFDIHPADLDEDELTTEDPFETAQNLAFRKAEHVGKTLKDGATIIGCDTVVALPTESGWLQLSKPVDFEDAVRMLQTLRGKTHSVITGVSVVHPHSSSVSFAESKVTFHDVNDEQIRAYVETGEPMDKAGAYGAQGMGNFLVKHIEGNFDTVVGLPVELVRQMLAATRVSVDNP